MCSFRVDFLVMILTDASRLREQQSTEPSSNTYRSGMMTWKAAMCITCSIATTPLIHQASGPRRVGILFLFSVYASFSFFLACLTIPCMSLST